LFVCVRNSHQSRKSEWPNREDACWGRTDSQILCTFLEICTSSPPNSIFTTDYSMRVSAHQPDEAEGTQLPQEIVAAFEAKDAFLDRASQLTSNLKSRPDSIMFSSHAGEIQFISCCLVADKSMVCHECPSSPWFLPFFSRQCAFLSLIVHGG